MVEKLQFKASEVSKFVQTTPHLRYGQEFYYRFKLSVVIRIGQDFGIWTGAYASLHVLKRS